MTRITVCGSAGSFPGRGRACSSYLLQDEESDLILDIGSGALANIQRWLPVAEVTNIYLSHGHHDHLADLVGLLQHTSFGNLRPDRVRVFANPETCQTVRELRDRHAPNADRLETIDLIPGRSYTVGAFTFEVFPAWHPVPASCIRITSASNQVISYTGDTALGEGVRNAAMDADLLISEATWLKRAPDHPEGVHMTGREAGELAAAASVQELLITHVWPEFDPYEVAGEAAQAFPGAIRIAEDNLSFRVGETAK